MADKRIFTIQIDGVKQSYEDVKSLSDILKELESVEKNIVQTQKQVVKSSKEKIQQLTEEEKIQKRLDDLQAKINFSQTEAAKTEAQLREELRQSNVVLRQKARENATVEDSIASQRAELARLRNEYIGLSKDVRESDYGRNMLSDIQRLTKETQKLNGEIGVTSDRVGSYENAIASALGINNDFAQSILGLSKSNSGSGGLSAFFDNAGKSAVSFGRTLLGLLSNPVFLAIAGIAGAGVVFKFWYDYNKGLIEATRLTKQFTGLAGNELKAFRNEVQGVADTFGKDFKETLEASNAVAKQFGISQQEALTHITDGFIAGADANSDFLNILKEYPAYFKEAGISASQFIAIVAETQNQGIFSDKGIDAIKEANIRIREMSTSTAKALDNIGISSRQVQEDLRTGAKTTFDVIQEVSEKLNEFPEQSKEVGAAVADIFGGAGEDAGLQYIKTLKDIDTNLDEVKKKTGQLGEIQERQMRANIELQNAVSALFDQTGGTFESMIGNAKVFVTESLTSIIKGLISVVNWFIEIYNNSQFVRYGVNMLIGGFKTFFELLSAGFNVLLNQIKGFGNALGAALTGQFLKIPGIIDQAMQESGKALARAFANIKNLANDSIDEINNGQLKPIEIPVNVIPETSGGLGGKFGNGLNKENGLIKEAVKEREDIFKSLERIVHDTWARIQEENRKNLEMQLKDNTLAGDREILRITNQYRDQIITKEEYEAQLLQISINRLQKEIDIRKKFGQDTTVLETNLSNLLIKQAEEAASSVESQEDKIKKITERILEYTQNISTAINSVFNSFNSVLQMQLDEANERFDDISKKYDEVVEKREESDSKIEELEEKAKNAKGGRLSALQEQINAEMQNNKKLADQEKQLAKEKERQEKEIAKKEKQMKRVSVLQGIAQAIADTSQGIMKAIAASPLTLGLPWTAVIGATGALQVGIMTAQLAKLQDGGLLNGKRHSQGGMRVEGTNIEVEGGEYVINRESTSRNLGLINYINSQRRTLGANDLSSFFSESYRGLEPSFKKMFETGGRLPLVDNTLSVDNDALVDAIQSIKIEPKVSVVDINNAQNETVKINSWTGL